jgi:hypothetical protein
MRKMEAGQPVLAALAARISKGNKTFGAENGEVYPLGLDEALRYFWKRQLLTRRSRYVQSFRIKHRYITQNRKVIVDGY